MRTALARAWPWLRVLLGVGILVVLMWRLGTDAFLDALRVVDGPALVAALVLGLLTTVLSAVRWCLVARRIGLSLPLGEAIADYYRSTFLNAALPGGVLGDVHRAVRHGQDEGDVGRGLRAVVIERTAGQFVVFVAGAIVLFTQPWLFAAMAHDIVTTPAIAAVVTVLGVTMFAAAFTVPDRTILRWRNASATALADVRLGLFARNSWPALVVLSTGAFAGHLAVFLVAARVAGSSAALFQLLPLMVLALLAMGLPVNVGGWGPREGVAALAFGAAGLGAVQGLTVAVVYGVLSFVAAVPGAGVLLFRRFSRMRSDRPQVEFEQRVLAEGDPAHRST
jgi:uncharacterized membrane protein YbhN (UPF0104 family)